MSKLHRRYKPPQQCGRTDCDEIHRGYFVCKAEQRKHHLCPGFMRVPIGTPGEDKYPGMCWHKSNSKDKLVVITDECFADEVSSKRGEG